MNMKKRTVILIGVVVLVLATAGLVAATMIPSAEELLIGSLERIETVTSGHAVINVALQTPEKSVNGTIEIWGELAVGPNGEPAARVLIRDASEGEFVGLTMVSDGSQFWFYNPEHNSVIVGTAEEMAPLLAERLADYSGHWDDSGEMEQQMGEHPESPDEVVERLQEFFSIERNGSGQTGPFKTDLVRLIPIAEVMPEEIRLAGGFINLALRADDQLPIAAEYAEGSIGHASFEISQIQINEEIDQNVFSFSIPEGAEVIQATDMLAQIESLHQEVDPGEMNLLTPGELPAGSVSTETEKFGSAVVQRFTLPDERSFVIAQGASIPQDVPAEATSSESVNLRGTTGTLHTNEDATRTLLIWQEDTLFVMVAGDLSPEQALAIAESLQ